MAKSIESPPIRACVSPNCSFNSPCWFTPTAGLSNQPTLVFMTDAGFLRGLPLIWQGLTSSLARERTLRVSPGKYYRPPAMAVSGAISTKGLSCLCTMQTSRS